MNAKDLIKLLQRVAPESQVFVIESGRKQIEITGLARPQLLFANQTSARKIVELSGVPLQRGNSIPEVIIDDEN